MTRFHLQEHYAQNNRELLSNIMPRLTRAYHSTPSPVRLILPWSLGKRRSPRNAIRIEQHGTSKRQVARRPLRTETVRLLSARSERHASCVAARSRNRPNSRASLPKRCALLSSA